MSDGRHIGFTNTRLYRRHYAIAVARRIRGVRYHSRLSFLDRFFSRPPAVYFTFFFRRRRRYYRRSYPPTVILVRENDYRVTQATLCRGFLSINAATARYYSDLPQAISIRGHRGRGEKKCFRGRFSLFFSFF